MDRNSSGFISPRPLKRVFWNVRAPRSALQPLDPLANSTAYSGIIKADAGAIIVIDPDGLLTELEAGALDALALPGETV